MKDTTKDAQACQVLAHKMVVHVQLRLLIQAFSKHSDIKRDLMKDIFHHQLLQVLAHVLVALAQYLRIQVAAQMD